MFSYIELRIWNQVSYDHRSYERNFSNCVHNCDDQSFQSLMVTISRWPKSPWTLGMRLNYSSLPSPLWGHAHVVNNWYKRPNNAYWAGQCAHVQADSRSFMGIQTRKNKADQTVEGTYIILSNISKGTASLHQSSSQFKLKEFVIWYVKDAMKIKGLPLSDEIFNLFNSIEMIKYEKRMFETL